MIKKRVIPENRRAPRTKHDSVLEILESGGRVDRIATLTDVSSTGASFRSTHAFPIGARIHARMRLLGQGAFDIKGHVVRFKEFENYTLYGIVFDSTTATPRSKRP